MLERRISSKQENTVCQRGGEIEKAVEEPALHCEARTATSALIPDPHLFHTGSERRRLTEDSFSANI
jgi:hypothetical protein